METTWSLVQTFLSDICLTTLAVVVLLLSTFLIHWVGHFVIKHVDLPRLDIMIRWLEYFVVAIGILLYAGIVVHGAFSILKHLLQV